MNHKFDLDDITDRYLIGFKFEHANGELGAFGAVARRSTMQRAISKAQDILLLETDTPIVVEIYRDGVLMESYHS